MNYFSEQDAVAFAVSLGVVTSVAALESWAVSNASDPILDDEEVGDDALKFKIAEMITNKFNTGDSESVIRNAQSIFEWIKSSTGGGGTTTGGNEFIHRIPTLNYTVLRSNGLLQNLIYNISGGGGTLTLPTGADAEGMVLYVSNTTSGSFNTSETIWVNSSTSLPGVAAGTAIKIVYNTAESKWYYTH